jgi:protein-tyrosine phosphatase
VIDLHCHLLPGLDDGPATIGDAVALAEDLLGAGVGTVVATPHVSMSYANDPGGIEAVRTELRAELLGRGLALEVLGGAEVDPRLVPDLAPDDLVRMHLGGGDTLLLECPFMQPAPWLEGMVSGLQADGHRVLLAHPERSPVLLRAPQLLERLVAGGALVSLTGASLAGGFGSTARRFACWALDNGCAHNVATDAHGAHRPAVLREALVEQGYGWMADWLTDVAPSAILEGRSIPPAPPAPARAPSRWGRLRKRVA